VQELARNAIEKYGMKRFAIVYPNDPYGTEYANLFWDAVLALGGQVTAAQSYSPIERDFSGVVSRLVGTYYIEDRADEYTHLIKDWYGQQKVITSRVTPPTDLLQPIVDFDAVFIPDGVKSLGQIASMLVFNDVKNVRLLGTNLWNSTSLVERGTSLIENSLFVDALSSMDNSLSHTAFFRDYKNLYDEEPSSFEAQAYDSGLVLRDAISHGARSRGAVREALQGLNHFHATVGDISVSSDREFTRPLTVLTVKDGKIALAPESVAPTSN
jgi:branched-chain amino acid transport system substrate-binding protein